MVQPDVSFYNEVSEAALYYPFYAIIFDQVLPPAALLEMPVNAVTTKFVRASTNKTRCAIFCTSVSIVC